MIHILFHTAEKKTTSNFQSPNTPTLHLPSSSLPTIWDRLGLPAGAKGGWICACCWELQAGRQLRWWFGVWPQDRESDHWTVWLLRETISLHAADGPSWENLCQTGSWQWGEGTSYFHRSPQEFLNGLETEEVLALAFHDKALGFFWSTCLTALLGTLGISYLLEVKHTKVLLSMRKSTVPNKQAEETKGGQETFHNLYTEIHLMILVPQRQVGESSSKKVSPLLVPKETSLTQDKLKWIAQTALSSRDVKEAEMQLLCQVFP